MHGSIETTSPTPRTPLDEPDPGAVERAVRAALAEDSAGDDVTTRWSVDAGARGTAKLVAKIDGIVAGLGVARAAFQTGNSGLELVARLQDGDRIAPGDVIADVSGSMRSLLTRERTALNFLQRLSGIATLTRRYCEAVAGTRAKIYDTRKTAPGLRALDKYAVRAGGGHNHRMDLGSMVLLKENHIAAAGGIDEAVRRVRYCMRNENRTLKIDVEVETLDQFRTALRLGVDWIMLDNMDPADIACAVQEAAAHQGERPMIEASGNVTLDTVRQIADAGVDIISVGSLTHSAPALDLSLLVD